MERSVVTVPNNQILAFDNNLENILFHARWKLTKENFAALSCLMFDRRISLIEMAYYNHLRVDNGSIIYLQSNHKNKKHMGFNDSIAINFDKLNNKYKTLAFVISGNQDFTLSNIKSLSVGISDTTNRINYILEPKLPLEAQKVFLVAVMHRADLNQSDNWRLIPINTAVPDASSLTESVRFIQKVWVNHKVITDRRVMEEMKRENVTKYFDVDKGEAFNITDEVRTLAATVSHPLASLSVRVLTINNTTITDDKDRNMIAYTKNESGEIITAHIHLDKVKKIREAVYMTISMHCKPNIPAEENVKISLFDQLKALELKRFSYSLNTSNEMQTITVCKVIRISNGWKIMSQAKGQIIDYLEPMPNGRRNTVYQQSSSVGTGGS